MRIGYACLTLGVRGTRLRTCALKNADPDTLTSLIRSNLAALDQMLDYNIENGIRLFRISSDIIPFGSHPVNKLEWPALFQAELKALGDKALSHGMRLSMHPGQYTVLNSPAEEVVEGALEDLSYHARFLHALGLGPEHKIILHVGGVYGDKAAATERFIRQYQRLDEKVRHRLVIENDDRQYNIAEVLAMGESQGIPVVFDNLHHQVKPDLSRSQGEWIEACARTWRSGDGPQKLHYSQQDPAKRPGAHSATVELEAFLNFCQGLRNPEADIMLEVKDKNLSAVKCVNALAPGRILLLEKEWGRYKYLVLEHSHRSYQAIRELLKDKAGYPVRAFYQLIEEALQSPVSPGGAINAAQHVWGYFKNSAPEPVKRRFEQGVEKVSAGAPTLPLKRLLLKLAEEERQEYLLNSLYFSELM